MAYLLQDGRVVLGNMSKPVAPPIAVNVQDDGCLIESFLSVRRCTTGQKQDHRTE
jgi:hypothetical protein